MDVQTVERESQWDAPRIACFLTDQTGRLSSELDVRCFLAKTDRVPLILGFANLLSRFKVCFDYRSGDAFVLTTG